jgi:hypothetical protein
VRHRLPWLVSRSDHAGCTSGSAAYSHWIYIVPAGDDHSVSLQRLYVVAGADMQWFGPYQRTAQDTMKRG